MKLWDLFEAASPWVKEDFGNWFIIASKNPMGNGKFSAIAKNKRNPDIFYKAEGISVAAAITAVKELLSTPSYPTIKNTLIALNFNVHFTTQYLSRYPEPYWFTLQQSGNDVQLIMAGEYYAGEPEEIKAMGFRQATKRLGADITDAGATQAWAVFIPAQVSQNLNLILNGRYQISEPHTNSEGNEVFDLKFINLTRSVFDKVRLADPGLTVVPRRTAAQEAMLETRAVHINWTQPNMDFEHHEVMYQLDRNREHDFLPTWVEKRLSELSDVSQWRQAAKQARIVELTLRDVAAAGNTGDRWLSVQPDAKKRRAKKLYGADKTVEMPIYLRNPSTGELWLIGGHHRSTFVTQVLQRPVKAFIIT